MRETLVNLITYLHSQGWAPGTGGNFSCLLEADPLRILITPSGVDKGSVAPDELLEVDADAHVLRGNGKPSAETLLHVPIYQLYQASVVLHMHSVWNTLASTHPDTDGQYFTIRNYEMLKGLEGVSTHEHTERIPVLPNSQDIPALADQLCNVCRENPQAHAVLLAGHGVYTWGCSFEEAKRHAEVIEFLFEVEMRARGL